MAQFRSGLIIGVAAEQVSDAAVGAVLDALKDHDGALEVEADRLTVLFSFDAAVPTGFAPGLVQAMPRAISIGRAMLAAGGLIDLADVIGLSIERIGDDEGGNV